MGSHIHEDMFHLQSLPARKGLCCWPVEDKNRTVGLRLCRNPLRSQETLTKTTLYNNILSGNYIDQTIDAQLLELLNLHLCGRHQTKCKSIAAEKPICDRWKSQLPTISSEERAQEPDEISITVSSNSPTPNPALHDTTTTLPSTRPVASTVRPQTRARLNARQKNTATKRQKSRRTNYNIEEVIVLHNHEYVPYHSKTTVKEYLLGKLTNSGLEIGITYTYIMQGVSKIGWTRGSVTKRRGDTEAYCRAVTGVDWRTDFLRHAYVAEQLSHRELDQYRLRLDCQHCGKTHNELFRVDERVAREVVNSWAQWIIWARPFKNGRLSLRWKRIVVKMTTPLTGQALLDYHLRRVSYVPGRFEDDVFDHYSDSDTDVEELGAESIEDPILDEEGESRLSIPGAFDDDDEPTLLDLDDHAEADKAEASKATEEPANNESVILSENSLIVKPESTSSATSYTSSEAGGPIETNVALPFTAMILSLMSKVLAIPRGLRSLLSLPRLSVPASTAIAATVVLPTPEIPILPSFPVGTSVS